MAAVLSPKSLIFPHNILHDNLDIPTHTRMQRNSPPKPLLPPITSLILDIDKQAELAPQRSPGISQQRRISGGSHGPHPPTPDCISFSGSPRSGMPPTPPLPGTSSFDFVPRHGTSAAGSPTIQNSSQNGYFARSPTRNLEAYAQRSLYPPVPDTSSWNSSGSPTSSRSASDESQLAHSGTTKADSSYPDPTESTPPYTGLAQQRPLPANFPPALPSPGQQLPPIDPQMAGTQYQHHHHYPATGATSYPQSNERYQCPTCQKAFSRPSSLKIHTYSHTGEKPFKCKYEGCGKYFSVRSNMKRHEKGCHGAETSSVGGNSPNAS